MSNTSIHLEILNPGDSEEMPIFDSFGTIRTIRYELHNRLIPGEYYGIMTKFSNGDESSFPVMVTIPDNALESVEIVTV